MRIRLRLPTSRRTISMRVASFSREIVGDAGLAAVNVGAAEFLGLSLPRRSPPSPAADHRGKWCPGFFTMTGFVDNCGT
jgi:hypothetical protein